MQQAGWAVVIPVKQLTGAKTRLRVAALGVPHDQLVLAIAQDTVRAVRACPMVDEVLVVTDAPEAPSTLGALGARIVPDAPAAGLNAAVEYGAAVVARPHRWVAVMTADLPALRSTELADALVAAAAVRRRGFVPDASGSGTTLLAAPPGVAIDPRFGPGSAARHVSSGARRLDGNWPSLRLDVDTAADLAEAVRLGLGPHTGGLWQTSTR